MPLGEVDNLIFSLLTYMDYTGVVPQKPTSFNTPEILLEVAKKYLKARSGIHKDIGLMIPKEIIMLFVRAAKTQRFGTVRPFCYVQQTDDQTQMQFSAISFFLPGGDVFVAFRGTDDSLVGWKENFNMSFMHPVPAQKEAVKYLDNIASLTKGKIYVGGHSKGGNLAIYASAKTKKEYKDRIVAVYNNDGPGFDKKFVKGRDFLSVKSKICTLVPQTSVVGMLFEHEEEVTVVKSNTGGILQHNGLTWAVMGSKFVHLDDIDSTSKRIEAKLKSWMSTLTPARRAKFADAIHEAFSSTSAKTLTDLNEDKLKLLRAWGSLDDDAKTQLKRAIVLMIARRNIK